MSESSPAATSNDWFRPTWRRGLFALGLAAGAFLLPQEVPLEWYPLNNPGQDILYLEISCAADKTGDVQIFYNTTGGINEMDSIRFPISPTIQTYTYTFPLPDAPITELRLDPVAQGGTLHIRQMRIIDRRGVERRRFTRDLLRPIAEIASVTPVPDGWKITSTPDARDPRARIELASPIIAKGINHRNLLRCLLSTGYLAGMLWILLLAVLFTFYRAPTWRDLLVHLGFMACMAALFAPAGNRGLIRNSIRYARYALPPTAPGRILELDLVASSPSVAQLFWDTGKGVNETDSNRQGYEPHQGLQTLRFPLPGKPVRLLRFDPRDGAGWLEIHSIRIVDAGQHTLAVLPPGSLQPGQDIAKWETGANGISLETTPTGEDPITAFTPGAVEMINRTLGRPALP